MQAVQVLDWAAGPKVTSIPRPSEPAPSSNTTQIKTLAVGLHNLVKSRASGKHYTTAQGGGLPHTLGVDGVGTDTQTGKTVYFHTFTAEPGTGSFAEYVNVPQDSVVEVPEGVNPELVAGLVNPVMSSWMALRYRVGDLRPGWTCLILGATSMSGKIAVHVAKKMGASKVYGAARREKELKEVSGLDGYVLLDGDNPSATDFGSGAASADVVLDYLYGPWPTIFLGAGAKTPVTWVAIGNMAGPEASIKGPSLRVRDVTLRGAGPGSWRMDRMDEEQLGGMIKLIGEVGGEVRSEVKAFGIGEVEEVWGKKVKERVVFTFDR